MPNLIYNTLQELGLEDKEIKIYLALLEIGEATVLNISRKSKVNRASIYYILEKMKKKGLVTHVEKSGKETFAATEPALLLNQQKSKVQNLKSIIPDLSANSPAIEAKISGVEILNVAERIDTNSRKISIKFLSLSLIF